ncbi:unnamed protein product, partial [Brassica oleracea]
MLKRFRSKPPQGSRLLRDITTIQHALRFANQDVLQAGNVSPLSDSMDAEESNLSPRNTSLRTDRMITKELHSISEMFPYL